MRKKIVAGNWKMNKSLEEALSLTSEVVNMVRDEVRGDVEVVLCTPYIYLPVLQKYVQEVDRISLGAQNCHHKASGAFTGEISASMLSAIEVPYVIIGHSERRQYFGETDTLIAEKVKIALENGLKPIFCCGELLEQRQNEDFIAIVKDQITAALFDLSAEDFGKVVIAYEPVWAIGTGRAATPAGANAVIGLHIRGALADLFGAATADALCVQYGGSVTAANAVDLMTQPDIDGALVGGASLKPADFAAIVKAAAEA